MKHVTRRLRYLPECEQLFERAAPSNSLLGDWLLMTLWSPVFAWPPAPARDTNLRRDGAPPVTPSPWMAEPALAGADLAALALLEEREPAALEREPAEDRSAAMAGTQTGEFLDLGALLQATPSRPARPNLPVERMTAPVVRAVEASTTAFAAAASTVEADPAPLRDEIAATKLLRAATMTPSTPPALGGPGVTIAGILPAQFIAKQYSEGLGRLPDQGGWQSALDFFAQHDCNWYTLATWGRSVYVSPEFNGIPYDNASKLLALSRGALNREPDTATFSWFLSYLNQGFSWQSVVDIFFYSEELSIWTPSICSGYSYGFGGQPVMNLPTSGTGFTGGTGQQLQNLLNSTPAGGTVFLAQKAVVRLDEPLTIPSRVTLATTGAPPHNHYARMGRLVRNSNFPDTAVKLRDGARLLNVWVDGARGRLGFSSNSINVQLFGGTGTTVSDSVITNTAGWSSLQALGRAENNTCASNTITRNLITVYTSDHYDRTWADGLSIACENALVTENEIVDATDVPIVLFRATPAVQHSQVRNNRMLQAGNSAYGGLVADPLRSGQLHDFTGAVIENNLLWTGLHTHFDIGISVGTRAWFGTTSDMGTGVRFSGNTTGSQYAIVATGIGVSGMWNATVQGNTLNSFSVPIGRCPVVAVGASVNAGYASGNLQPYTDVLIQGCIGH